MSGSDFDGDGLGKGIFGGIVTFADQMGTKAGKIGVRILNGEQAKAIPIDTVHPIPVFDENQLKRWRVERKNLPVKSLIVNERDAFWRTYGNYILNYLYIIIVTCPVSGVISLEVPEDVTSKYIFRESSTTDGRNVEEEDRNIV